jgi:hypothetical protein
MATKLNIEDTSLSITALPDLNAYVIGYYVESGKVLNGSINCAYSTSTGSITNFGNQWVDISSGGSFSAPRLAYMPLGGGTVGRLFATWNENGAIVIGELQIVRDAGGVISVTAILQKKSLAGCTTNYDPAIAVVGNLVIVAYQQTDNSLNIAVSNDVVAQPGTFTFASVGRLGENTCAGPALTAVPGGQVAVAWKGFDSAANTANSDISVATYSVGSNAQLSKTSMLGITDDAPGLTFANGELYLAFLQQVNKHVCIWPQTDWNRVNAGVLVAFTYAPPSLCAAADGSSLVLAWRGTDNPNNFAFVEFEGF